MFSQECPSARPHTRLRATTVHHLSELYAGRLVAGVLQAGRRDSDGDGTLPESQSWKMTELRSKHSFIHPQFLQALAPPWAYTQWCIRMTGAQILQCPRLLPRGLRGAKAPTRAPMAALARGPTRALDLAQLPSTLGQKDPRELFGVSLGHKGSTRLCSMAPVEVERRMGRLKERRGGPITRQEATATAGCRGHRQSRSDPTSPHLVPFSGSPCWRVSVAYKGSQITPAHPGHPRAWGVSSPADFIPGPVHLSPTATRAQTSRP